MRGVGAAAAGSRGGLGGLLPGAHAEQRTPDYCLEPPASRTGRHTSAAAVSWAAHGCLAHSSLVRVSQSALGSQARAAVGLAVTAAGATASASDLDVSSATVHYHHDALQAKCEWKDGQAVVGSDAVRIISLVPHSIADICSEQLAGCALVHVSRAAVLQCCVCALTAVISVPHHLRLE